ncbi:MAG TPA: YcxB family protein [Candidatus Eremiobacteraceae bacterium]|jgi:YcxB-like protein|nr:YcxB family protein [Candidatus Eremiobacteraceae bacterium]
MLPEPHNKPYSIATDVRPFDLGYAYLYSRWVELYIYLVPVGIVLSALFGFIAFKVGASTDITITIILITAVVARSVFMIAPRLYPLPRDTFPGAKTTAHIFTAEGVELKNANGTTLLSWRSISKVIEIKKGFLFYRDGKLATFLPARNLEGPAEAELIRKFVRQKVADATLRG